MIYVFSGYPRSGTSMGMQAVEAGGMKVVKSERRSRQNQSRRDGNYLPNPVDLYEPDFRGHDRNTWPREYDGMALKLVALYVNRLAVHEYRVAFMMRDSEEIRQSLEAAFNERVPVERIEKTRREALLTLRNRKDVQQLVTLEYTDVLADPIRELSKLDWPFDVKAAAAVVDKKHYRFQLDKLVVGL